MPMRSAALLAMLIGAAAHAAPDPVEDCPARPSPSVEVANPPDVFASGGVLTLALTLRSRAMAEFPLKICYAFRGPSGVAEAPTLRVAPGDLLDLALRNRMAAADLGAPAEHAAHDACAGGSAAATATNLAFPGLAIDPVCHAGEARLTTVASGDPPFSYRFRIPADTPPGLQLYLPHLAPTAPPQVESGASGALIVAGIERLRPDLAGMPERVLLLREQFDETGNPDSEARLSLNFQPVGYRGLPPPLITMRPRAREFWRVANATAGRFLDLSVRFGGVPQPLDLVARDGLPRPGGERVSDVALPPGGRAEFIVAAPAQGGEGALVQGAAAEDGAAEVVARLALREAARPPPPLLPLPPGQATAAGDARPAPEGPHRRLYFGEALNGTNGPARYFLTLEGMAPRAFASGAPPAIYVRAGTTEVWQVENRTLDDHAFRMPGVHVMLLAEHGRPLARPEPRDTVTVPAWTGQGAYPAVTLRMDFRATRPGPRSAECAVLRHAALGMALPVQVEER